MIWYWLSNSIAYSRNDIKQSIWLKNFVYIIIISLYNLLINWFPSSFEKKRRRDFSVLKSRVDMNICWPVSAWFIDLEMSIDGQCAGDSELIFGNLERGESEDNQISSEIKWVGLVICNRRKRKSNEWT